MTKTLKFMVFALLILGVAAFSLIDVIPPRSLTEGNMGMTKRRIIQYARLHDRLPATLAELAELPPMADYHIDTNDAWKHPLEFSTDSSGVITLRSLGADHRPGGEGDNRDMIGIFASRDAQGAWIDELAE